MLLIRLGPNYLPDYLSFTCLSSVLTKIFITLKIYHEYFIFLPRIYLNITYILNFKFRLRKINDICFVLNKAKQNTFRFKPYKNFFSTEEIVRNRDFFQPTEMRFNPLFDTFLCQVQKRILYTSIEK